MGSGQLNSSSTIALSLSWSASLMTWRNCLNFLKMLSAVVRRLVFSGSINKSQASAWLITLGSSRTQTYRFCLMIASSGTLEVFPLREYRRNWPASQCSAECEAHLSWCSTSQCSRSHWQLKSNQQPSPNLPTTHYTPTCPPSATFPIAASTPERGQFQGSGWGYWKCLENARTIL